VSINVRLPVETEAKLVEIAITENKTKSEIIRESLELYFDRFLRARTPFELGKEFFGKHGSGAGDLAINSEKILREKIKEKYDGKKYVY